MKRIALIIVSVFQLAIFQQVVHARFIDPLQQERLQDGRMKIKKEELPEPARKTLGGDAFKGWSIVSAYKTKEGDYEVEMKKGDTTQTVKFDKEGKVK